MNVYHSLEEWISASGNFHTVHNIVGAEINTLLQPKGIQPIPPAFSQVPYDVVNQVYYANTLPSSVVSIPNGRIYGEPEHCSIIAPDNKLIWDISWSGEPTVGEHWFFKQERALQYKETAESIAILTIPWICHQNYYHWTLENLSRINLIRKSGMKVDKFIMHPRNLRFHYETLNRLGILDEQIIEVNQALHLKANQLIVPRLGMPPLLPPKWACEFVRKELFTSMEQNGKYNRIYISRGSAKHRKITNEDEVSQFLNHLGFQKITLENYTLNEQIQLIASADIIVSPHGAGLANLIFAKPGTKIIELFNPSWAIPLYWVLSNWCNLDYYFYIGDPVGSPSFPVRSDMSIQLPQLKNVLELAGV
ncbi:glycosyltransferase family 61 protein [Aneurinibacillus aneurinilyticus]|uniref:glycosyltransferase family 61 protein n=1 Tax=Aneurinibacillus aneurinilyticus TaxID=1391 RepID=UPI00366A5A8C